MSVDQRAGLGRRTTRAVGDAVAQRRYRLAAVTATIVYLLVFLVAIRDVTVNFGGLRRLAGSPSIEVVPDWTSRMFEQIAPFYFEAIGVFRPVDWAEILISPVNIAIGLILGLLVGVNVAVAWHLVSTARACRTPGFGRTRAFGGLIGALPAFLAGMACCVPALVIVAGAQFAVFITAVRSWFVPIAIIALVAALLWNVHRASRLPQP